MLWVSLTSTSTAGCWPRCSGICRVMPSGSWCTSGRLGVARAVDLSQLLQRACAGLIRSAWKAQPREEIRTWYKIVPTLREILYHLLISSALIECSVLNWACSSKQSGMAPIHSHGGSKAHGNV
uniref:Uncharacterized protein n=1 Tax=Mandrillus leucophaeus TaxID=9568 RepID=A0A2K6A1I7_MANLE